MDVHARPTSSAETRASSSVISSVRRVSASASPSRSVRMRRGPLCPCCLRSLSFRFTHSEFMVRYLPRRPYCCFGTPCPCRAPAERACHRTVALRPVRSQEVEKRARVPFEPIGPHRGGFAFWLRGRCDNCDTARRIGVLVADVAGGAAISASAARASNHIPHHYISIRPLFQKPPPQRFGLVDFRRYVRSAHQP